MAHFAKVIDGVVANVIVAEPEFFDTFVDTSPGQWVQCSYNTRAGIHATGGIPLRKNYPGIGYIYDNIRDAFYLPRPFPSWNLDEDTCLWICPVAHPEDTTNFYGWNETNQTWDLLS